MPHSDYDRIERAIVFLEENWRRQPSLDEVARSVHLSEFHFQRLFRRWAGISPKRFLQYLTIEHAKRRLEDSAPLLETAYDTGLSSLGRLHDLFVTLEAVTPGEFRRQGAGLHIACGLHATPFGTALVAVTERGVCALSFASEDEDAAAMVAGLRERWPLAAIAEDERRTAPTAKRIFDRAEDDGEPVRLHVEGTNFQVRVWEALLRVPFGALTSYEALAAHAGRPAATRAVASAVARNPVGYLIPCHRVIRKLGVMGGYRWGPARKKAILAWEAARVEDELELLVDNELAAMSHALEELSGAPAGPRSPGVGWTGSGA
jgi:AraC family transcriptional regulator of adaptative response/methylated-DNA-[protein]-cysteine methyltransferase